MCVCIKVKPYASTSLAKKALADLILKCLNTCFISLDSTNVTFLSFLFHTKNVSNSYVDDPIEVYEDDAADTYWDGTDQYDDSTAGA